MNYYSSSITSTSIKSKKFNVKKQIYCCSTKKSINNYDFCKKKSLKFFKIDLKRFNLNLEIKNSVSSSFLTILKFYKKLYKSDKKYDFTTNNTFQSKSNNKKSGNVASAVQLKNFKSTNKNFNFLLIIFIFFSTLILINLKFKLIIILQLIILIFYKHKIFYNTLPALILTTLLLFLFFNNANTNNLYLMPPLGCQQLHMCCTGRNYTCKSLLRYKNIESDYNSNETVYSRNNRSPKITNFLPKKNFIVLKNNQNIMPVLTKLKNQNIGDLIFSDLIALNLNGERIIRKYRKFLKEKTFSKLIEVSNNLKYKKRKVRHKLLKKQTNLEFDKSQEYLIFGSEFIFNKPYADKNIFLKGRSIIRYSILNKFLPLQIGKKKNSLIKFTKKNFDVNNKKNEIPVIVNKQSNKNSAKINLQVMYVTKTETDCFCDSACLIYDDCCFDYKQYCQPIIPDNCYYSSWSNWSKCRFTNKQNCGSEGLQNRFRTAKNNINKSLCNQKYHLIENRACFSNCVYHKNNFEKIQSNHIQNTTKTFLVNKLIDRESTALIKNLFFVNLTTTTTKASLVEKTSLKTTVLSLPFTIKCLTTIPPPPYHYRHRAHFAQNKNDIDTVALLIDYNYNETRMMQPNRYKYYIQSNSKNLLTASTELQLLPTNDKRFDFNKHKFYCVRYELGWVNHYCLDEKWRAILFQKNIICAECQPHAQLHRNTPRCASDLDNNQQGFWKLIGPRYCYGIWRRIERTINCKCSQNFPNLSPFLIV